MIPPSAYYGLLFRSGYFMTNEDNIAEYSYICSATALRICDALSNFRTIDYGDVYRRMVHNPLIFTIGDLTSPLGSLGASSPNFSKAVSSIFETRYGEDAEHIVKYMDFPDTVEGAICSLATVTTMFYFANRSDESTDYEYDIIIASLLSSAVECFSKFDFAELNWLITIEEVATIYNMVAKDSEENKAIQ